MGYYINVRENYDKAKQIAHTYFATIIKECPKTYADIPKGMGLICVVHNPAFEAAAFIYSEDEFKRVQVTETDRRPREWILLDRNKCEILSGYKKEEER